MLAYLTLLMCVIRAFTWLVALFTDMMASDKGYDWMIKNNSVVDAMNDLWWIRVMDGAMITLGIIVIVKFVSI